MKQLTHIGPPLYSRLVSDHLAMRKFAQGWCLSITISTVYTDPSSARRSVLGDD
jgi:hypothetical protein